MTNDRGPHGGSGLNWTVDRWRDRSRIRFGLHLRDGNLPVFRRKLSRPNLRLFVDAAVDAIEGTYHSDSQHRFTSNPFYTNRIEITEHREAVDEHLIFGRKELERLVTEIDELLED